MATTAERKRSSYTAAFKLHVVDLAERMGNRAAGRMFQIDDKSVRLWRKNKDVLMKSDKNRRANRGGAAHWPELEDVLLQWLKNQRDLKTEVSIISILTKARALADEMGISNFGCKRGWCVRFLKRKNLKICDGNILDESTVIEGEKKAKMFLQIVEKSVSELNYETSDVVVISEVPIDFEYSKTSESTKHNFDFTVVLACSADGLKLKPLIIFRTKDDPFGEDYPEGIEVEANEEGSFDAFVMGEWLDLVWRHRKEKSPPNGVLVVDPRRARDWAQMQDVCDSVFAKLLVIPEELSTILQPFESTVLSYFQAVLRFFLRNQMSTVPKSASRPNLTEIADWVKVAWSWVSAGKIKKSFVYSGLFQTVAADGTGASEGEANQPKDEPYDEDMLSSDSDEFDFANSHPVHIPFKSPSNSQD